MDVSVLIVNAERMIEGEREACARAALRIQPSGEVAAAIRARAGGA